MSTTVQKQLLKFALIVNDRTKKGQRFNDSTSAVNVSGATNASPIVITTATAHGLSTGHQVYITSVGGNTAANNTTTNPNWTITYLTATTYSLDGSTGNGAYTSGGTATPALIGSVDGSAISRQRMLDMYNDARLILFQNMHNALPNEELSKNVSAAFIAAAITFTAASPNTTAPKPSGYLKLENLMATGNVQVVVLENDLLGEVKEGINPHLILSATNLLAFEEGANFVIPGLFGAGAGTIEYYGITNWTLADVLAGTAVEVFSTEYEPYLIEIAQAISEEQGQEQVNSLALMLIGKGK